MRWRHGPSSIRVQVFLLAALPILLLATAAAVRAPIRENTHERMEWANFVGGMIVTVVAEARASAPPDWRASVVEASAGSGLLADPAGPAVDGMIDLRAPLAVDDMRKAILEALMALSAAPRGDDRDGAIRSVGVRIADDRGIVFHPAVPRFQTPHESVLRSLMIISIIVLPIVAFAYYASHELTRHLIDFAREARRVTVNHNHLEPIAIGGASEIRSIGNSLNAMRSRVNRMISEQTALLRSLGHDLRTPLTRLQMRAERCADPELQRLMLHDIATLSAMIDEAMRYLSDRSAGSEAPRKVDLSSLMQTICTDYADMSVPVAFLGPPRLVYRCMPKSITRALSNLIDNAAQVSSTIELALGRREDGSVFMEVRDDGPGMSDEVKTRALEPFFKGDTARTLGPRTRGVGLGLAIANGIAKSHDGTLTLLDADPRGLVARITLPAERP